MTNFQQKTFTVAIGKREPKDCEHGWFGVDGRCVFCGVHRFDTRWPLPTPPEA